MITDLPPQIQNIPSKPAYAVIEQYVPNRPVECASKQESNSKQTHPDPKHFGGYITTSGTAQISLASGITQNMTNGWVPWNGPIPEVLIQLNHEGYLFEIKPELTSKKV